MKKNRVLFGLFVGLITLAGGSATAQNADSNFYEIGPTNISGKVTSLALGTLQPGDTTIYAGSANGGLFVRTTNPDVLRALYSRDERMGQARREQLAGTLDMWHYIRYVREEDGREVALPINAMIAAPDGAIFIGTGAPLGNFGSSMYSLNRGGCGVFRYDPADGSFTMLAETDDNRFSGIYALDYIRRNDTTYLFVAATDGLYRWAVADSDVQGGAWGYQLGVQVVPGTIRDVKVVRQHRIVYASTVAYGAMDPEGAKLYRIGDATLPDDAIAASVVDITTSNPDFIDNATFLLAVAPNDPEYLYAMAINRYGYMAGVYLTTNGQTWTTLTTSSVLPFSYTSGTTSGTLCVDPKNPKRIIIGGTDLWIGQGYVENSYYQWTAASSNEFSLMYQRPVTGDYMDRVFNNSSFVHSGINDLLAVPFTYEGELYNRFYIATNGGVFETNEFFNGYANVNRGLNTISVNGLSVAPDGTVLLGADGNSCPIIEPILTHVGGEPRLSWFDDGSLGNFNHDANVLWQAGDGGQVATSSFQQYAPQSRRTIFTSTGNAMLGRSYADYMDYLNTTTWTTGQSFMTDAISGGPTLGQLYLWETDTNTVFNSTVKAAIDTLGYIFRRNESTGEWDTIWINAASNGANRGSKFQIKAHDRAVFSSRGHADYPFEYEFTANQLAGDSIVVRNPVQSRMVTVAYDGQAAVATSAVWYSWSATDFTKVWESGTSGTQLSSEQAEKYHWWAPIFAISRYTGSEFENTYVRNAVISNNGRYVYVSAYDLSNQRSMLFRISGFEKMDFSNPNGDQLCKAMTYRNDFRELKVDTLKYAGNKWIPRGISSIAVDPRAGEDRLILTFDGFSYVDISPNVMIVENASSTATIVPIALESAPQIPAYCALVEDSTGIIYVGTEKGVYTKQGNSQWQLYEKIPEIPVTAMFQQTKKLPLRRNLSHIGINANNYVFAKTKWPRAIYFGTNGRGVFMDMSYVTDRVNEIVDSVDYTPVVGIPTVSGVGLNSVSLYPNPVTTEATLELTSAVAGRAVLRVYDLNGRCVVDRNLGYATEGKQSFTLSTEGLSKGMYLVNVIIGGHTAATKMMVR
ncbi:MAG: T9SS type A sorting domain-containing protein [Bacteroidales bacterium]|nr:T9SS type A sorting domain-containing protein [Bacteroidales bacterium]